MVDSVPVELRAGNPETSRASGGNLSRTRSLISRFLMCGNAQARVSSPDSLSNATTPGLLIGRPQDDQVTVRSQPRTIRRNPHRRSTGQLATGQAIRKTFSISALSLLVNVKKDRVHWHGDGLQLVVDAITDAHISLTNMRKGSVVYEVQVQRGLGQSVHIPVSKHGLYSIKIAAKHQSSDPSIAKVQRTELELHKGNDVLIPRIVGQYVHLEGGGQYSLLEIYGLPSSSADVIGVASEGEPAEYQNGEGLECVVCLSSDRDTIVLPCRHLCLCAECAENLRSRVDKCPICRECCQGLLQVKLIDDKD